MPTKKILNCIPPSPLTSSNETNTELDSVTSNSNKPIMTSITLPPHYPAFHPVNEFQRFLLHESFPQLILLATQVKFLRHSLLFGKDLKEDDVVLGVSSYIPPGDTNDTENTTDSMVEDRLVRTNEPIYNIHKEVCATVHYLRSNIMKTNEIPIVSWGVYPLTDELVTESMDILKEEVAHCRNVRSSWRAQNQPVPCLVTTDESVVSPSSIEERTNRNTNPIVVKYSKFQTDVLTDWMIEHKSHPFPSATQIKELSRIADLSYSQVVNWTTNVRKRNLKQTVTGKKKPHHFLDFVFLADDRQKRFMGPAKMNVLTNPVNVNEEQQYKVEQPNREHVYQEFNTNTVMTTSTMRRPRRRNRKKAVRAQTITKHKTASRSLYHHGNMMNPMNTMSTPILTHEYTSFDPISTVSPVTPSTVTTPILLTEHSGNVSYIPVQEYSQQYKNRELLQEQQRVMRPTNTNSCYGPESVISDLEYFDMPMDSFEDLIVEDVSTSLDNDWNHDHNISNGFLYSSCKQRRSISSQEKETELIRELTQGGLVSTPTHDDYEPEYEQDKDEEMSWDGFQAADVNLNEFQFLHEIM